MENSMEVPQKIKNRVARSPNSSAPGHIPRENFHSKIYMQPNVYSSTIHNSQGMEVTFNSVQFSRSVMSNSMRPHESQHARPPCPSPTPWVYSNSCPLSQWCNPAVSSSVVPFSSCPQSLPATGSFPMRQLFTSGGQSTGVSASTSVLPMDT